ncbi:MAG: hypothetical protein H6711_00340 [Myxococcales bacterium]|nr:hypothetical protein [Myxococcales bacterium]
MTSPRTALLLGLCLVASACGGGAPATPRPQVQAARPTPPSEAPIPEAPPPAVKTPADRYAAYAPVVLTADVSGLPEDERAALAKVIEAARHLDPIFDLQAYEDNPRVAAALAADTSPEGQAKLALFRIMRGPWDRQEHFEPFAIDRPRPPGAGFYPIDLTADDFKRWVAEHPKERAAFESLTTVIRRDADELVAIPYHKAYAEHLGPAAAALREAAALTKDRSLKKFLSSRAAALLSDDYYKSDKDWMDVDAPLEVTIGPYETYEDELMGLKAAYEAFVTISDPAASADLARFKARLADMEANLPIDEHFKTVRGRESPIRVVDLVYTSGDARKSVQTIAFNLPNDERVRAEKGAKKVLLRNLIQAKFDAIMRPIGERVLVAEHLPHLSADAFFHQVLFHELSHSLGPAYVERRGGDGKGEKVEIRVALGPLYSPLEEAKADVMGVYNILYMIDEGELPAALREPVLVSYIAGLFRSLRFGTAEAHGRGAAIQLLFFASSKAITQDRESGKIRIDQGALEAAVRLLVTEIVNIQALGSEGRAEAWIARFDKLPPELVTLVDGLADLPIDVRPIYPLAGEGDAG